MTNAAPITAPLNANDIATIISKQASLPEDISTNLVRDGVAIMLDRAGKAIAAHTANAKKVIASLSKIETLSGLKGEIVPTWLALRALGLSSGAQIGCQEDDLNNPVVAALISAAGLVPTTDIDADVRGIFGALGKRDIDTLASGGRVVAVSQSGDISVSNGTGVMFAANCMDAQVALTTIDTKSTPRQQKGLGKIGPISYNTVEAASLSDFAPTVFAPYRVRRVEIPGSRKHPTDLVESSALASVLPPVPRYEPHFHGEIITSGILSDVQLETIIYAGEAHSKYLPSHPDDNAKVAPRQGFLIGHGTGFGKNRAGAGIIADNWAQGRRRHLWISENARLIEDARADWVKLGGKASEVIDIRELNSEAPIPPFSGIIFASYASLRTGAEYTTRLKQMADWFGHGEDGCINFDEAQNLRNAKESTDTKTISSNVSQQGLAALELQDLLPNARVTYISATSASDIVSLGFAIRLGLWGKSTAFPTAKRFFDAMHEGGTNALEMVARDLKAMGLYLAANLSFEGVKYERLQRKLTLAERDTQDRLADVWLKVNDGLQRAMVRTGASRMPIKAKGRSHKMGSIHYMMSRARFFQALQASLNTPQVIDAIRDDIANGYSSVIQLTNTFAANADRAIEEAEENGISIDDVEASAKDILLGYLRNNFPTICLQAVKKGKHIYATPILDKNGDPVEDPQAAAIRDQLIASVQSEIVPEGPLEQLLRAFGPETLAEVTGRSRRLVPNAQGGQTIELRTQADVIADAKAFMDDEKRLLVFSQAGGTGATYSAQRTRRNQRLRRHYVLQAGWRADIATQGMGRTHRSDQAQPPEYILVGNDLWASQRMVSAVAKGMRDLGALTRGLRQAASQEFFTSDDNLEDEFAEMAWIEFVLKLNSGLIQGLSIGQFEREACISLRAGTELKKQLPPVRRFLNAMSAMTCDNQTKFGQHYRAELAQLKLAAVEDGSFDRGIETIVPDSLLKLEDQVIYRDQRTGGETRLLKMLRIDELKPIDYADGRRKALARGNTRIVKSLVTNRIAILSFPRLAKGQIPQMSDKVEVIMPTGSRLRTREEIVQERWTQVESSIAESLWNAELRERGDEEERDFWVITGAMLPIWDKLPRDRSTVYRMETDEGEQVIGRLVSEDFVGKLLKRVDALTGGGLPIDEVDKTLTQGGVVQLANGWVCQGRVNTVTSRLSITMSMPIEDEVPYAALINTANLKRTIGPLTTLAYYKILVDDQDREKALTTILAQAPAVGAASL